MVGLVGVEDPCGEFPGESFALGDLSVESERVGDVMGEEFAELVLAGVELPRLAGSLAGSSGDVVGIEGAVSRVGAKLPAATCGAAGDEEELPVLLPLVELPELALPE